MKTLTTQEFIRRSVIAHANKYDYTNTVYINAKNKVKIICVKHGIFEQYPHNHLKGHGCKLCQADKTKENLTSTTHEFIKKATEKHRGKYDYSQVIYNGSKSIITIICKKHGEFNQLAKNHLLGRGCNECKKDLFRNSQEDFLNKCMFIHGEKYNYDLANYEYCKLKIKIICPDHGVFEQRAGNHSRGAGCPLCKSSTGEEKIRKILDKYQIKFKKEHMFKTCVNPITGRKLRFDFFVPKLNLVIEYDGEQHFRPVNGWGGDKAYHDVVFRDGFKTNWCKQNNINLLRIPYTELDNVEKILKTRLNI